MQLINLVFEGDYSDADILAVPDEILDKLEEYLQDFYDWLPKHLNEHSFWAKTKSGDLYYRIGTDEILWWINQKVLNGKQAAFVVQAHCHADPNLITIET